MSALDELLATIPMDQLAARLGTDEATAEEATRQVLPNLLGQLTENAFDPGGELPLAKALQQHFGSGLLDSETINLEDVDVADGKKIVGHVFGKDSTEALGLSGAGAGSGVLAKLLPLLAPIVMAYLGKKIASGGGLGGILGQVLGGGEAQPAPQIPSPNIKAPKKKTVPAEPADDGGVFGDILGQIMGRDQGQAEAPGGGNILGDILGQITGSQTPQKKSGGGFLDNLLGGLLGK